MKTANGVLLRNSEWSSVGKFKGVNKAYYALNTLNDSKCKLRGVAIVV